MALNKKYVLNPIKSHYIARMRSSSLQAYHQLFESVEKPFLYTAPWWLDATCGIGGWNAVIQYNDEQPMAGLAFHQTSIRGLSAIITPPLTQWVSILSVDKLSFPVLGNLLSKLPATPIFDLTLKKIADVVVQDAHFPIDLRYSFILPYVADEGLVSKGYNDGLRHKLRQAKNKYSVEVTKDISTFIELCHSSYQQQNMKTPPWFDAVLPRVFESLNSHQVGQLVLAFNQGKAIAGVLTAWDAHSTYYIAGGRAGGDESRAAHSILLDEAILKAHHRKTDFDFEGSMHPGIASFFQSFGASPTAYWHIKKYRGLGKIWSALR